MYTIALTLRTGTQLLVPHVPAESGRIACRLGRDIAREAGLQVRGVVATRES